MESRLIYARHFWSLQGGKSGLVSWIGETEANEGKQEKIKNNLGEPWTVTDEINANTLINLLEKNKSKSAVTIYKNLLLIGLCSLPPMSGEAEKEWIAI